MNDLQKTEVEILKIFIEICNKLGLHYYVVCGTALGAAKYKGFIPWDDDIDVALPRSDYDLFVKDAPKLLPEYLFLQNYKTDPEFAHIFSKLRDSRTTYIEKGASHLRMNHGVYIDVFPLDGYPNRKWESCIFDLKKKIFSWKQYCALSGNHELKVRVRNRLFRLLGYHKRTYKVLGKMEKMYRQYPLENSKLWCNHGNWQGKLEYAPCEQYGRGIEALFEGVKVQIPENYDAYLTQKYGDWRNDPPKDKQKSHHNIEVCDLSKPYKEYFDELN